MRVFAYNISRKEILLMQFVKERLAKWINAAIIIVVGVLCIVAGAALGGNDPSTASDSLNAISITLGVILIIVGSLSLVLAILAGILAKKSFAAVAMPGAFLLAVGISLVVIKYAASLIGLLIAVVPYLLIALGAVVLADAIYTLVRAIIGKDVKAVLVSVICSIIVAVAAIVLGCLCIGDDPVIKSNVQLIVFGIIVCLVGALQLLLTFVKLPDAVVTVVTVEKKEEKAE